MNASESSYQDKAILEAAQRMAKMAEHYDDEIQQHLDRISAYCEILVRALNISETEAQLIVDASCLHDIGMVGVSSDIVQKDEGLTHDDWEIIKQHPALGEALLQDSDIPLFQMGAVIAFTHHERWDGSGYPQGLRADEIPLAGRICGIVDAFDLLTTKRTYRKEVIPDTALHLIKESSGTFFDPSLVEVFAENFDAITRIRSGYLAEDAASTLNELRP